MKVLVSTLTPYTNYIRVAFIICMICSIGLLSQSKDFMDKILFILITMGLPLTTFSVMVVLAKDLFK